VSEIPEDIMATARSVADTVNFGGYEVNTLAIAKALQAEREAWEDKYDKQVHRATNAEYFKLAYRNMLGEKGEEVAKKWAESGVTRVHFDWGPEAHKLTGEERAAEILKIDTAVRREVSSIDGDFPTSLANVEAR